MIKFIDKYYLKQNKNKILATSVAALLLALLAYKKYKSKSTFKRENLQDIFLMGGCPCKPLANHKEEEQKREIQSIPRPRKSKLFTPNDKPDLEVLTRGIINIYYGTTSGNSCQFAFDLSNDARLQGYCPKVTHLGDFNPQELMQNKLVIFCVSTYGHGGPTQDAEDFHNWLHSPEHSNDLLKNLNYTVFGLGSCKYEKFCFMGINTDQRLEELGAKRIYRLGKGDAGSETTFQDFANWKKNLWDTLNPLNPQFKMKESELQKQGIQFTLEITPGEKETDLNRADCHQNLEKYIQQYISATSLQVLQMKELRQKPEETSCIFVSLAVANTACERYQTAGNIAIYPENEKEIVEELANILGYNLDQVFTLYPKNDNSRLPVPSPMSVKTLLTKFCDVLGPISKNTLYVLSQYVADEHDRQSLERLCQFDASHDFEKKIIEKKHSLFSIIYQYNIQLPLDVFISISNRILPRYYTISSSSLLFPQELHLTISMMQINSQQRQGFGLTSQFIRSGMSKFKTQEGFYIKSFLSESCFKLPKNSKTNIIMVANGAGLAPFRAFIQEKFYYQINNIKGKLGKLILFFGCRAKDVDFIYCKELEKMKKDKILNQLFVAFSREKDQKVYVQDLMAQNTKMIGKMLLKEGGIMYICGSSGMGEAIHGVLETVIQETKGIQAYQAYSEVTKLSEKGIIIKEIWG